MATAWAAGNHFRYIRIIRIRLKDNVLYRGPRLRKGKVFAYVGLRPNLKDLKDYVD